VLGSPIFFAQRTEIVAAAASHRMPAIYPFRHWVELGGLMSYGSNLFGMYRYASTYVDKILQGAKPADLPVEQPAIFEMAINLKTAKALGLTVPPSILLQATKVIE